MNIILMRDACGALAVELRMGLQRVRVRTIFMTGLRMVLKLVR